MDINMRAINLITFITKGDRSEFLASETDSFISDFEKTKEGYLKSGLADSFAELVVKLNQAKQIHHDK
jgi:hypothetical protein